ncbi:MAG: universal stress protein, partial [Aquabacterium sp.]|nr:universal stress protein [Aquabacterium sp.]
LEGVRARALHLGHSMVELSLRQGKLTDALLDLSAETRMVVMGQAAQRLADAGFSTHIVIESGDVAQVLGRHLTIQQLPLLVMSAFTHNGWRQKLLGTTTSTLLRRIPTSVLVLR